MFHIMECLENLALVIYIVVTSPLAIALYIGVASVGLTVLGGLGKPVRK